jgi:hypothetical protein
MYRLQHLNIIVSTDSDKKKAAYQAMGYQLLSDTSTATASAATAEAKATTTTTTTTKK